MKEIIASIIIFLSFLSLAHPHSYEGHKKDFDSIFENLPPKYKVIFGEIEKEISAYIIDSPIKKEKIYGFTCGNHR